MLDDSMKKAIAEFVTNRINYHSRNESKAVSEVHAGFRAALDTLGAALDKDQTSLLRTVENASLEVHGEVGRFFYEAGFGDAIMFLMGWNGPRVEEV